MSVAKDSSRNKAGQITCPFCQSSDNELFSLFGQTLIGSQYYCRACRSVFESVRWEEAKEPKGGQPDDTPST